MHLAMFIKLTWDRNPAVYKAQERDDVDAVAVKDEHDHVNIPEEDGEAAVVAETKLRAMIPTIWVTTRFIAFQETEEHDRKRMNEVLDEVHHATSPV
jgi:hypothetical protein